MRGITTAPVQDKSSRLEGLSGMAVAWEDSGSERAIGENKRGAESCHAELWRTGSLHFPAVLTL